MAALARNSILNPLATCFIPSSLKSFYRNYAVETNEPVKNVKTEENSNDLEAMETSDSTLKGTDIEHGKKSPTEDTAVVLFNIPTNDVGIFPPEESESKSYAMEALAICHLILLVALDIFYKRDYEDKRRDTLPMIEKIKGSGEECQCPPMFGWVLPSTFFGNPLKLKYNCSKNRVHATLYSGESVDTIWLPIANTCEKNGWKSYNSKVGDTLEQCWLEFQMIIQDVCDTLRFDDSLIEFEETPEASGCSISEVDDSDEPERFIWNDATEDEVLKDLQIVDDGSHPLLQSVDSNDSNEGDGVEVHITDVEKMLERCLSPNAEFGAFNLEIKGNGICDPSLNSITGDIIEDPRDDFDKILKISSLAEYGASVCKMGNSVCNPPCSVWCDRVPSSVKKTYVNFIKRSESFDVPLSEIGAKRKHVGRPSYKRSLSADDTKYANSFRGLSTTSEAESKERLMLRKDPIVFFKHAQPLKDEMRQHRSYSDLSDCNLKERSSTSMGRSNSWGPFDGADSLWQPLPDCVSSTEDNPKHGSHRRFRDMRRQRSVN